MKRLPSNPFALAMLAMETTLTAQQVIGLRLAKAAVGGAAAEKEAALMIREKTQAALQVQQLFASAWMTGSGHLAPARALRLYHRKVRANRRRLLKARA